MHGHIHTHTTRTLKKNLAWIGGINIVAYVDVYASKEDRENLGVIHVRSDWGVFGWGCGVHTQTSYEAQDDPDPSEESRNSSMESVFSFRFI